MAYQYCHYETSVMQEVIDTLTENGRHPILWVHDCVYTLRNPAHNGLMTALEHDMRKHNPHIKFNVTLHDDWDYVSKETIDREVEAHSARMAEQERIAQQKYGDSDPYKNLPPNRAFEMYCNQNNFNYNEQDSERSEYLKEFYEEHSDFYK
jgi:hypothetical protein